jgi:hypothetical protein
MSPIHLAIHVKWPKQDRQLMYYSDGSVSYQTLAGVELWKDGWTKSWEHMLPVVIHGGVYLFAYKGGMWGTLSIE